MMTFAVPRERIATSTFGQERTYYLRSAAEAAEALDHLTKAMQEADYAEKDRFGVRLALEEAVANAVKHGHQGDPSRPVRLRYHLTPDYVLAEIEDQGPGFDPSHVPDPLALENLERDCGRGLLLMRSLMTWCRHNRRGNRVTLCKDRTED